MKFSLIIQQKTKIAFFLFCIMGCTILIRVLEDKSIKHINTNFISLYNDRLIPSTDLFSITESIYMKRTLLDDYFSNPPIYSRTMVANLEAENQKINALLKKYEQTYLIQQEKNQLEVLKNKLKTQHALEAEIISKVQLNNLKDGEDLFETKGKSAIQQLINTLSDLNKIQTQVGKELINDAEFFVSGSKLYSSIQLGLAVVIGVLIIFILHTSNVIKMPLQKFDLN